MTERVPVEGYKYALCRREGGLGHAWVNPVWFMGSDERMRRKTHCLRCPVTKVETVEGWVVRRSYSYPEDYHLDHRPTRGEILDELLSQVKVHANEAAADKALKRRRDVA